MELVVIRWAVPTVEEHFQVVGRMEAEHFQVVVPTVEERSQAVDLMAGAVSPLTRDASFVSQRSLCGPSGCGPSGCGPATPLAGQDFTRILFRS